MRKPDFLEFALSRLNGILIRTPAFHTTSIMKIVVTAILVTASNRTAFLTLVETPSAT